MNKSVTTFVILPLASEEATAALESQKSESWKKTLSNVKSYAGVQLLNWGLQVENKKKMMLLIDWESFEALKASESNLKKEFLDDSIQKYLAAPPSIFTVKLDYSQKPPSSLQIKSASPVTEIVLQYFEGAVGEVQRQNVHSDGASFIGDLYKELPSIESFALGWQLEEQEGIMHPDIPVGLATVFVKILGWPSMTEHMKARDTKAFQANLPNLRQGAQAGEMKHVHFAQWV